jgi:hypothetical protein
MTSSIMAASMLRRAPARPRILSAAAIIDMAFLWKVVALAFSIRIPPIKIEIVARKLCQNCRIVTKSDVHLVRRIGRVPADHVTEPWGPRRQTVCSILGRSTVVKILIAAGLTVAMVTAAAAADLPHPQPVYQTAQVGKMPIGKSPVGKGPIGKSPVGKAPYTRTY